MLMQLFVGMGTLRLLGTLLWDDCKMDFNHQQILNHVERLHQLNRDDHFKRPV
jgi:hypothetical protein